MLLANVEVCLLQFYHLYLGVCQMNNSPIAQNTFVILLILRRHHGHCKLHPFSCLVVFINFIVYSLKWKDLLLSLRDCY